MSIHRVEFKYKKPNLRHDPKTDKWIGYQIDVRHNGTRHRNTFGTKGEAERFVDALKQKQTYSNAGLKAPAPVSISLSQLFAKRLAKITNEKEVIRATRIFNEFIRVCGSDLMVRNVRTAHFQTFVNKRLETVKPSTVYREVNTLATPFHSASALFPHELEDYEPPRIARPSVSRRKTRNKHIITAVEKDKILHSILNDRLKREFAVRTQARPIVAAMFEVAWMLGLRLSEVTKIKKSDLNAKEQTLRVVRWKTEDVDTLEFVPKRVIEILSATTSTNEFIFNVPVSDNTFRLIIKDACQANGIIYGRDELDGVTFHSNRHSFTTRMQQVTDMATTASYTGHSSREMVDYYSQASKESRRRAMQKMYSEDREQELAEIFDRIRSENMDFQEFVKWFKKT